MIHCHQSGENVGAGSSRSKRQCHLQIVLVQVAQQHIVKAFQPLLPLVLQAVCPARHCKAKQAPNSGNFHHSLGGTASISGHECTLCSESKLFVSNGEEMPTSRQKCVR